MRILFVAFPNSIHTARWITQISDQGWDLHLAPSTPFSLHPYLEGKVTFHETADDRFATARRISVQLLKHWPYQLGSGYVRRLVEHLESATSERGLTRIIQEIRPDIIHSLVIQHAGYLTLATRKRMGRDFPCWINGNWGSSIYLLGRLAEHKEHIEQVLAAGDYLTSECDRDVALARQFGFKGQALPVLPSAGGFDLERWQQLRQPGPTSARKVILLKGYQHWVGRALVGLRAIELCADVIRERGYSVLIHLASPDVPLAAELVSHATGIPITVAPFGDYEDAMRRYGVARIHLGLSISDGISQSLLESMVMGAFPIQSCTACANEWIEDGKSGQMVPPEDPHVIAKALRRAVIDDDFVDQAVRFNDETVRRRLSYAHVKDQVIDMYKSVFTTSRDLSHVHDLRLPDRLG